jgi:hypothetical protein
MDINGIAGHNTCTWRPLYGNKKNVEQEQRPKFDNRKVLLYGVTNLVPQAGL